MPPRPKKVVINDREWEKLRHVIRQLYLQENRTLKDVLIILGTLHNFHPSKSQLEGKLKQWHMTKNMAPMEWKYLAKRIQKRRNQGKESSVYLSGMSLRPTRIERSTSRYCYETAIEKAMKLPPPPSPTDLSLIIRTPSPEIQTLFHHCNVQNLPWVHTQDFLKGLSLTVPRRNPGTDSEDHELHLLSEGLLKMTLDPKSGLPSTYTARLQHTFEALSLVMPEESQEKHVRRAENLLHLSHLHETSLASLEVPLFLLSNNLFNWYDRKDEERRSRVDTILRLMDQSRGWDLLKIYRLSNLPWSLQSIFGELFKEAVVRSDLKAVKLLLEAGLDVDLPLARISFESIWLDRATAFQFAALVNDQQLMRLLHCFGADTQFKNLDLFWTTWTFAGRNGHREKSIRAVLTGYKFNPVNPADQRQVQDCLFRIDDSSNCRASEMVIEYFRSRVQTPECIVQLLITAVKTHSVRAVALFSEHRKYANTTSAFLETPLAAAASIGDLALCERLIEFGARFEPDRNDATSLAVATPLQCAAYYSKPETVRSLLAMGANIDFCHVSDALIANVDWEYHIGPVYRKFPTQNRSPTKFGSLGKTALHAALLGPNSETALFLIEKGCSLTGGELSIAIHKGSDILINTLLSLGGSILDSPTPSVFGSPLESAILAGRLDLVSYIVERDSTAITPRVFWAAIWMSAIHSNSCTLDYLFNRAGDFPDFDALDLELGTAMSMAAVFGVSSVSEKVLSMGYHPEKSLKPSYAAHRLLEESRLSPSRCPYTPSRSYSRYLDLWGYYDDDNWTSGPYSVIEVAAYLGQHDHMSLLLMNGYQPSFMCGIYALDHGDVQFLQLIHEHGSRLTCETLANSIRLHKRECTQWLLAMAIDLNEAVIVDRWMRTRLNPRTPLQEAVLQGDSKLVETLLIHGADINAPAFEVEGATALQLACMNGHFGIVQRLLELGADPNAPGAHASGSTALEGAARCGRLDVVQLLLNSGVRTRGSGRRQYVRAVKYATRECHYAVVNLLKSQQLWTEEDQEIFDDSWLLAMDQNPRTLRKRQELGANSSFEWVQYGVYDWDTSDSESEFSDGECSSDGDFRNFRDCSDSESLDLEYASDELPHEDSLIEPLNSMEESGNSELQISSLVAQVTDDIEPWGGFAGDLVDRVWDDAYRNFLEVTQLHDCSAA